MMHLERYVTRIKPAIEGFINDPRKDTLSLVEREIEGFNFGEMRIYQVQTVVPLVVKLNDLTGESQELRTGLMNCLRNIVSHSYLADEKGLRSILVVVLQQIRDSKGAVMRPNLSEEIKLAAVLCIHEALSRCTTDVLEAFYTNETVVVIGQILLTLLEIIEAEKYRKLVKAALQCLMVLFYVHNESDRCDVVLRSQVANTIFIFLPKVLIVLFKASLKDEKVGETIKSMSIQALGRIICIMFEETTEEFKKLRYDVKAFRNLFNNSKDCPAEACEYNYFGNKSSTAEEKEERLHQMQKDRRSLSWVMATSRRIRPILVETSILRAHTSPSVRSTYAEMCCLLLTDCAHNLRSNFIHILESVLALSEDDDRKISQLCKDTLLQLQQQPNSQHIFDENAELLLDAHLNKWPRVLHRGEDNEQFAELLFLKGFLRNVNAEKLQLFFLVPKNLEMFVTCLLTALDMRTTRDLLNEEYSLRRIQDGKSKELAAEFVKLPWRQFKHVSSKRTVDILSDIAALLGAEPAINRIIFDYCQDLVLQRSSAMNESILLLTMMVSPQAKTARESRLVLAELLLEQILRDEHWSLALQPDAAWRLKVDKPTQWFEDRTPGLYSSAIEVRTQDCDSDDEQTEVVHSRVSIADAQFNVLHTCLILDAVGHCAKFIGDTFDRHIFLSLHRVLLKLASSNTFVHHAATFAFVSMQLALKYAEPSHFIECSTDYITFHLNALLKRSPESTAAVDILTVVLQYSSRLNVPHLDSIFQTIREECSKSHQTGNVQSYLRVFNAFLKHVSHWHSNTTAEINAEQPPMQVDEDQSVLSTWLHVLEKPQLLQDENADINMDEPVAEDLPESDTEPEPIKPVLPRHIEIIKDILGQVIKFVSTAEQSQQIVALECFASGVPLLADYENELLPLVHLIWRPLVEKFRQKDALVLNRCFTLLHLLGIHAKDFIAKRSLSDVIPQLKQFLKVASVHSKSETPLAQTQEYKLQLLLLQSLGDLILGLQLEGKHLHDLLTTVALYLSQAQPPELQTLARKFFLQLAVYNGPFVYVTLLQRAHLKDSKTNVSQIFGSMGFRIASEADLQ
ncbi:TELO2-interacting protein 1 homolog [Drosophila pseudoobscura]|uniref:TELO2-interacting protein 1 homolog n=1 Tax=Drosophila pseudoobscura pseudoobscura TaxID=46245 RepID=A0A6I8UP76_DROPS|nr:TELO2-interacting protein 1 homolog [Drosophila pseudoobscura]